MAPSAPEFGFSKSQMGQIITTALLAYACGQIINGLLSRSFRRQKSHAHRRRRHNRDERPLRRRIVLGIARAFYRPSAAIDGYMQAFGAPGMVKINAAWFHHTERGGFAGIFGFMINLGTLRNFQTRPRVARRFCFSWDVEHPAAALALVVLDSGCDLHRRRNRDGNLCEGCSRASRISAGQSGRRTRRRSARAGDGCSCDHCFEPGRLDHRVRLCVHRRGAPGNRSVVPAFHERSAPCRFSIGAISSRRVCNSVRRLCSARSFPVMSPTKFLAGRRAPVAAGFYFLETAHHPGRGAIPFRNAAAFSSSSYFVYRELQRTRFSARLRRWILAERRWPASLPA